MAKTGSSQLCIGTWFFCQEFCGKYLFNFFSHKIHICLRKNLFGSDLIHCFYLQDQMNESILSCLTQFLLIKLCRLRLTMKFFLSVEFLLVEGNKVVPSQLDAPAILLLETSCSAIRLAARSAHHYFGIVKRPGLRIQNLIVLIRPRTSLWFRRIQIRIRTI